MSENRATVKQNIQESSSFGPWMLADKSGRNRTGGNMGKRFLGHSSFCWEKLFCGSNQSAQLGRSEGGSGFGGPNPGKGNLSKKFGSISSLKGVNKGLRFQILYKVNEEGLEEVVLPQERVNDIDAVKGMSSVVGHVQKIYVFDASFEEVTSKLKEAMMVSLD
ncbi:hypothetical protein ACOSQ4_018295 [Xanthoceras sorbifolium]